MILTDDIKSLAPHQLRVVKERAELSEKIDALEAFCFGKSIAVFDSLDQRQQSLLTQQLDAMKAYEYILGLRISYF